MKIVWFAVFKPGTCQLQAGTSGFLKFLVDIYVYFYVGFLVGIS